MHGKKNERKKEKKEEKEEEEKSRKTFLKPKRQTTNWKHIRITDKGLVFLLQIFYIN